MNILNNIKPQNVMYYFEEISRIPRGSGNTKKICRYLENFAKQRNLEHYTDENDNVIIIKKASQGFEKAPAIILQGHTDMVCEKNKDCKKDMTCEGIDLCTDKEWIYAKGTTLGADDGIAIAMILAVLDDEKLLHPQIEAVMTSDEETGMTGAKTIDLSHLQGKTMINIDSGEEGIFTIGCAGGVNEECFLDIKREYFDGMEIKIAISGLCGGHSGADIHLKRANANKLMARLLDRLCNETDIRVGSIFGGSKVNAIPREADAYIVAKDYEKILKIANDMQDVFKNEYIGIENNIKIGVFKSSVKNPMNKESTNNIIKFLNILPDGVQKMSDETDELVQTSLNMGIITTHEDKITVSLGLRSCVETDKKRLSDLIGSIVTKQGGYVSLSGDYKAWQYNKSSRIFKLMSDVFSEQYGYASKSEVIHAGLECAVFTERIAGLDCISCGPDMLDIHTPGEKVNIKSVSRVYEMIVEVLKRCAKESY